MKLQPDDLQKNWHRVSAWLRHEAATSYDALSSPSADLVPVKAHFGYKLPPPLRAWLTVVPGTHRVGAGCILPWQYRLLAASDVVRVSLDMEKAAAYAGAEWPDLIESSASRPAGAQAWAWLSEFVPIAENFSGNCLFIDLRAGQLQGCIKEFDHEQGALAAPLWTSLDELLRNFADALEQGLPFFGCRPEVNEEKQLLWMPDG